MNGTVQPSGGLPTDRANGGKAAADAAFSSDASLARRLVVTDPFLPRAQGLYNPAREHDSCGVGFVADIDRKSVV